MEVSRRVDMRHSGKGYPLADDDRPLSDIMQAVQTILPWPFSLDWDKLGQDILDICLLSTLADAICCPNKVFKKHRSLKSCTSYIRAFMIPMFYDFSSDDRHYTCNSCFSVISSCSDNMFHRPHFTAKMCRGCSGQVWTGMIVGSIEASFLFI